MFMLNFLGKLLNSNEGEINKLKTVVEEVNILEPQYKKLKEKDFPKKTAEFKLRLERGESLDQILPEAFALVREASVRVNNQRHFDEQIMGAITLHQGKIAEQKTGEGKTLTASMPLYLNALTGKGAHLVTVNDYLAKVGVGWMGPIFHYLGLTSSAIIHDKSFIYDPDFTDEKAQDSRLEHLKEISRKEAYAADVTYGINSEFGFDYLRDNMAKNLEETSQRGFHYAIVDEVDSVLIDEARTPHIISAPDSDPSKRYYEYAGIVGKLTPELDYIVDEKLRTAHLTDHGISKVESLLGVKDIYENDFATVHHLEAALKARTLFLKEKDYIVRDNEVIIVDEFTGRLMQGRRWSDGIHQAVEAKEGVPIQQESKTLASISLQNYFRKYEKLAGMTGTAITESEEFGKIYKLEVLAIPTHRKMVRQDFADQVYKTARAKYAAVVKDIEEMHKIGRPVLVGTTSIEKNEIISQYLTHKGIQHKVLNAKQHEKEAMIISEAGKKGSVTVATNMAGRGVDIILGGNMPSDEKEAKKWQKDHDEVVSLGGLHVIGTERHESRRIDNQLRGRAGRQGDPGSSRFFVALDDEIMRLFGGDQVSKLMSFFNIPEDQPLEHGIVSKSIEQAQTKVEQFNFDSRKHLLEYDDVMNKQREIIYDMRRKILEDGTTLKPGMLEKIDSEVADLAALYGSEDADIKKLVDEFSTIIPFDEASQKGLIQQLTPMRDAERIETLQKIAKDVYEQKENQSGEKITRYIEQQEMLRVIDTLWMEHLETMEDVQEAFRGVRRYGEQGDPIVGYKKEAFDKFEKLIATIDYEIVHRIYKVAVIPEGQQEQQQIVTNAAQIEDISIPTPAPAEAAKPAEKSPILANWGSPAPTNQQPAASNQKKLGRNDPCWCGSGKKYKKCHYPN